MRSPSALVTVGLVVTIASLTGGCPNREVSELNPVPTTVEEHRFPLVINRNVDILFVIDNSDSMSDEQASLRANFGRFIEVLDNLEGGLPDVHIGVVTSDMGSLGAISSGTCAGMGDNGRLHVGTAVIDGGQRFLSDLAGPTPGTRIRNYDQGGTVSLEAAFGQLADVGVLGCPFEQHLEAMRASFENPDNEGFLRDDAHLAVIVLADEDDCSAYRPELFVDNPALGPLDSFRCFEYGVACDEPPTDPRTPGPRTNCHPRDDSDYLTSPAELAAFLEDVKPSEEDIVVAAIVGDPEPVYVTTRDVETETRPTLRESCTYDNPDPAGADQTADPAVRIAAFLDAFADRGELASICNEDLSGPLQRVAEFLIRDLNNCVIGELTDVDPSTEELDYECTVHWSSPPDSADAFDEVLPRCDAGATNQPCWRLVPEARCASYPTGLAFEIVRDVEPLDGTRINTSCVVE